MSDFVRWPPVNHLPATPRSLRDMAEQILAEAKRLEAEAEAEADPGPQDIYVEGTVIRFTKPGRYIRRGWGDEFGDDDEDFVGLLKYAGIRAGGEWFLTGKHTIGLRWNELLDFIGADNYATVNTFGPTLHTGGEFGRG